MTFGTLKAKLAARGFQYLTPDQLGEDVQTACQELDDAFLWPYRQKDVTGLAPVTLPDMVGGTIEAVTSGSPSYQLQPGDYRSLLDDWGDLAALGRPVFFYVAWQDGTPLVATFPTSTTAPIGVVYYRSSPELTVDADVPLAPARFHRLILDIATQHSYRRTDNFAAADGLQPAIEARVSQMVDALLGGQQIAGPQGSQAITDASTDW